jgi:hypothetical protein
VDYQTFLDRLTVRGARLNCPSCGNTNWLGFGGTAPQMMILTTLGPADRPGPRTEFRAVGAACTHCGYVRLHSLDIIGG